MIVHQINISLVGLKSLLSRFVNLYCSSGMYIINGYERTLPWKCRSILENESIPVYIVTCRWSAIGFTKQVIHMHHYSGRYDPSVITTNTCNLFGEVYCTSSICNGFFPSVSIFFYFFNFFLFFFIFFIFFIFFWDFLRFPLYFLYTRGFFLTAGGMSLYFLFFFLERYSMGGVWWYSIVYEIFTCHFFTATIYVAPAPRQWLSFK